jgi:hypothetical protein
MKVDTPEGIEHSFQAAAKDAENIIGEPLPLTFIPVARFFFARGINAMQKDLIELMEEKISGKS